MPIKSLFGLIFLVIIVILLSIVSYKNSQTSLRVPGKIKNVFVIVMENNNWSGIQGNPSASYINSLLTSHDASYATQYYNPPGIHPSEPNYIWIESGTNSFPDYTFTTDDDPSSTNSTSSTNHLTALMQSKGISWKAYAEDISGNSCPLNSSGNYAAKHVPFVFFKDVWANCISHIRPYTELADDLQNNTVSNYNFITPNLCNDMHSCPLQTGDAWLSREVPKIMSSNAYKNNGAIFVIWDEGENNSDGPLGMIVLSKLAKGDGYYNNIHYDHSSFVKTIEEIFGLSPILSNVQTANDLSDLFGKR